MSRLKIFTREVLAVIPLWIELGASPGDIAAALGTTENSLRATCSRCGISLRFVGSSLRSALTAEHWSAMRREAARRGLPVQQLMVNIISVVVTDDLFAAVLGDCADAAKPDDGEQKTCAARS